MQKGNAPAECHLPKKISLVFAGPSVYLRDPAGDGAGHGIISGWDGGRCGEWDGQGLQVLWWEVEAGSNNGEPEHRLHRPHVRMQVRTAHLGRL